MFISKPKSPSIQIERFRATRNKRRPQNPALEDIIHQFEYEI